MAATKVPNSLIVGVSPNIIRLTSGSGTYVPSANVKWLRIRMVGGGGGGGGSGTGDSGSWTRDGAGGNTTFGTSLLIAGGASASNGYSPGSGGTNTINSPAIAVVNAPGGQSAGISVRDGVYDITSSPGAPSFFGGNGRGVTGPSNGSNAATNSGSGGGGAGLAPSVVGAVGLGGSAGGYVEAIIPAGSVAASYPYTIGAPGTPGGAGPDGFTGGAGGDGLIIIEEYY